ncbi:hypothetical protein KWE42_21060 [Acinetobacter pittii]|uniref:Uncharacterized protein n=1 Tax=Acinetobacter pittii TaxID=48296 RepID=A0AAE9S860_ACIPI|nr:hypothetical protein [Acinetobacter pittii]AZP30421.1 hypothetical protein DLK06_15805 [Acinetobacter pittii]USU93804.1 hypothetical protein MWH18_15845 [Acinetobacter pittii]
MKPEQFIREFGAEKAREVVEGAPEGTTHYDIPFEVYLRSTDFWNGSEWKAVDDFTIQDLELPPYVDIPDLKRLVDSLDLIKAYGGIESCKQSLYMLHELTEDPEPIREAVRDHESIYGGGDE